MGLLSFAAAAAVAGVLPAAASTGAGGSFVGGLNTVATVASTVPANGDVNPYGVAIVPRSDGRLTAAITDSSLFLPYLAFAACCGAVAWYATRIPRGAS